MATVIPIHTKFLNKEGDSEMEKTMDQWELRRYIIENYDLTKWYSFWGWFPLSDRQDLDQDIQLKAFLAAAALRRLYPYALLYIAL